MKLSLWKIQSGLRIMKATLMNKRIPLFLGFSLTYRCNSNCSYCNIKDLKSKEMGSDEILYVTDELCSLKPVKVSLSGGEPLLREELGEISRMLYRSGISHSINTNGILVPDRIYDIKRANILLSIDGDKEINDNLRGKGCFASVIKASESLLKSNIPFSFTTVITEKNCDIKNLEFLLLLSLRFRTKINFQTFYTLPGHDELGFSASREKLRKAVSYLIKMKKKGLPVSNSTVSLKKLYMQKPFCGKCIAGNIYARIRPDGTLVNCSKDPGCKPVSIFDHGLREAFMKLPQESSCSGCTCFGTNELNSIYHFSMSAMINAIINY